MNEEFMKDAKTDEPLVNITDVQKMALYMEFADGANCALPLTAKQASLIIFALGLVLKDDVVSGYSDEKLDELFAEKESS